METLYSVCKLRRSVVTCVLSELPGLRLRQRRHLVAFGVQSGVLKTMEVDALAVNHQV